ncbi:MULTISPECIES: LuxR C-terminal-related transcriptional regulator [Streptomyces]|uniref:LuxR C-terminal-related transcriptional regulator n=1 Tax=Streptomyces TaxID=1883 RepID=UPI000AEF9810|nr:MULTISPECIES: response regulator transcription factor [Streptomyces]MDX2519523.1 response regulator transcription factor [Streptomyces stelliscabiei]MDX2553917.1 response regulator transcription factor [Streptomyces stelliscabiei]MDX2612660.1 response regulator transcription factor [Streptomyces stelliscabiei]MDX2638296.1 response regulator transcription factor [Streptomyces stelliscabiei]MDX2663767.1 response regulator transcription factor [Streptomyces stelliscabiei]
MSDANGANDTDAQSGSGTDPDGGQRGATARGTDAAEGVAGRPDTPATTTTDGDAGVTAAPGKSATAGQSAATEGGAGAGVSAVGRHVRVVLVDDHRMFRTGVRAEIGQTDRTGVEVVGEAPDVDQAVSVITSTRPEVVLLDVHLPGGGGVEVLRRCSALMADAEQPVRFLALSVSDAAEDVIGVIRGGARGYVTKTITGSDLVNSIFRVQEGDAVFSPRLAGFVLDAFASTDAPPVDEDLDRLTQREREVLRLIARGYAYKEIAKQLYISVKTVESHVSAVLRKLQLSNRHELTRWATARRLV